MAKLPPHSRWQRALPLPCLGGCAAVTHYIAEHSTSAAALAVLLAKVLLYTMPEYSRLPRYTAPASSPAVLPSKVQLAIWVLFALREGEGVQKKLGTLPDSQDGVTSAGLLRRKRY